MVKSKDAGLGVQKADCKVLSRFFSTARGSVPPPPHRSRVNCPGLLLSPQNQPQNPQRQASTCSFTPSGRPVPPAPSLFLFSSLCIPGTGALSSLLLDWECGDSPPRPPDRCHLGWPSLGQEQGLGHISGYAAMPSTGPDSTQHRSWHRT